MSETSVRNNLWGSFFQGFGNLGLSAPLLSYSFILLLISCHKEKPAIQDSLPSAPLQDYIYQDSSGLIFLGADSLRYSNSFLLSNHELERLATLKQLSKVQQLYLFNQLAYNSLALKDLATAKNWLDSADVLLNHDKNAQIGGKADFHFNRGKYALLNEHPNHAIRELRKAALYYQTIYAPPHLRIAEVNLELARYYGQFSTRLDSVRFFLKNALDNYDEAPELYRNSLSCQYLMSQEDIIWKSYDAGLSRISKVIEFLESQANGDSILLLLSYLRKAKILRLKRQRAEAKQALDSAYQLWKQHLSSSDIGIDVLEGLAYFYLHQNEPDSLNFFNTIQELRATFPLKDKATQYANRLESGFYTLRGNHRKAIDMNLSLQKVYGQQAFPNYTFVEQSNYQLIEGYTHSAQFDSATYFLLKEILFATPFQNGENRIELIYKPEVRNKYLNFIYYYKYANLLVKQYERDTSNTDPLKLAIEVFQLSDTLVYNELMVTQEDEALNILSLVESLYDDSRSIHSSYLLYYAQKDVRWLNFGNQFIERSKSSVLFRNILTKARDFYPAVPDRVREKEIQLNAEIQELRRLSPSVGQFRLTQKLREQELFLDTLRDSYPRYHRDKIFQSIPTVADLQTSLSSKKECILQYHSGSGVEYLIFIHPDTTRFLRIEIESSLAKSIDTFKQELRNGIRFNPSNFNAASFHIFQELIAPVWSHLKGIERLVIIPSKRLDQMPFEAILTHPTEGPPDASDFLISDLSVKYAHSLKIYQRHHIEEQFHLPEKSKALALAFGKNKTWPPLPHAEAELQSIKDHLALSSSNFLFGKKATKNSFVQEIRHHTFDLIHLAMHAQSSLTNKFYNRIFFHSLQAPYIDTLYTSEIMSLPIKAQLVVLSSCQTATGLTTSGEGTYSITRAFLEGGANTVISSLWDIQDQSSAEIVSQFYFYLGQGEVPSEALRQAKLDFMANHQNTTPILWAPLICF